MNHIMACLFVYPFGIVLAGGVITYIVDIIQQLVYDIKHKSLTKWRFIFYFAMVVMLLWVLFVVLCGTVAIRNLAEADV